MKQTKSLKIYIPNLSFLFMFSSSGYLLDPLSLARQFIFKLNLNCTIFFKNNLLYVHYWLSEH